MGVGALEANGADKGDMREVDKLLMRSALVSKKFLWFPSPHCDERESLGIFSLAA